MESSVVMGLFCVWIMMVVPWVCAIHCPHSLKSTLHCGIVKCRKFAHQSDLNTFDYKKKTKCFFMVLDNPNILSRNELR